MRKSSRLPLLIAAALGALVSACSSFGPAHAIPREAEELYGDLTGMELEGSRASATAHRTWVSHTTAHFTLLTDATLDWSVDAGQMLEFTRESFYKSFNSAGLKPSSSTQRLVWVAFRDRQAFNRYALGIDRLDMSWSDGYYSTRTNRVALVCGRGDGEGPSSTAIADSAKVLPTPRAVFPNLAQSTHEAAHQLAFNTGLQKRGVMYPLWASEGLATSFEAESDSRPIGPEHDNSHRRRQILSAVEREALIPLEDFVVMTRVPVNDPQATHDVYAQSWAFFRFLYAHRPQELKRYYEELATLEPGRRDSRALRREFQRAFGSVDRLERSWQAYLRLLDHNPSPGATR